MVDRYSMSKCENGMECDADGQYVGYEDYVRLQELVKSAYEEGWCTGWDTSDTLASCWQSSGTLKTLKAREGNQ